MNRAPQKFNISNENQSQYINPQRTIQNIIIDDQLISEFPIGVLNIKDECVWLTFKKSKFFQPDIVLMSYQKAKCSYPSLVAERLLYQKLNYASLIDNTENQEQGCIYDLNEQQCLMKWLPSEKFSWIDIAKASPILILEYLESKQSYQIQN